MSIDQKQPNKEVNRDMRHLNSTLWVTRLVRYSKECTLFDFKCKLYEVLWMRAEGYESVAEIANELYRKFEVCAIYFARYRGYGTFEAMLHSDELERVVTIETIFCKSSYKIFHYRATLNSDPCFSVIRKRMPQQKRKYTNPSFQELNQRLAGIPTEAQLRMRRKSAVKKQRKVKEIYGPIFNYEVDVDSDREADEVVGTEFIYEDDEDAWGEVTAEDGDEAPARSAVIAENDDEIMEEKTTNRRISKGKWQNEKKDTALKTTDKCSMERDGMTDS